ncbi:hypothetical protein [Xenorhabdus bovienii]|nr:hypothetical protein [Xenorhabdus bovienii]
MEKLYWDNYHQCDIFKMQHIPVVSNLIDTIFPACNLIGFGKALK